MRIYFPDLVRGIDLKAEQLRVAATPLPQQERKTKQRA